MPVLVRTPSIGSSPPTPAVAAAATTSADPIRRTGPIRAHKRAYTVGDVVQVRSGGSEMIVQGYAINGEVVCELRGRTFELPELLLKTVGSKPVRRGRKPGISPCRALRP